MMTLFCTCDAFRNAACLHPGTIRTVGVQLRAPCHPLLEMCINVCCPVATEPENAWDKQKADEKPWGRSHVNDLGWNHARDPSCWTTERMVITGA
jgi:hypothetical protein